MPNKLFFDFLKNCLSGGALTAISSVCLLALHLSKPEAAGFANSLQQNTFGSWVHWNLGSIESASQTIAIFLLSISMLALGLVTGTLGTCYVQKAREIAKKGIDT